MTPGLALSLLILACLLLIWAALPLIVPVAVVAVVIYAVWRSKHESWNS